MTARNLKGQLPQSPSVVGANKFVCTIPTENSKLLSATRTRLDMPGSNAPWSHTQLAWNASNVRTSIFKMFPSTWTVYQTCPNVQTLHVQHDHQAKSGLQRLRRTDVVGLCFPVKS